MRQPRPQGLTMRIVFIRSERCYMLCRYEAGLTMRIVFIRSERCYMLCRYEADRMAASANGFL